MGNLGDGEIALLLGEAAGDGDPATRPAASQLRKLAFRGGSLATVDPSFNPAARPIDVRLPELPGGVVALDLAAASDEDGRRLYALGNDGHLYALADAEAGWMSVGGVPDDVLALDLGDAGDLALAARRGEAIVAFTWAGDAWQLVGEAAGEDALVVDAMPTLAGGPLLLVSDGVGDRLVRWTDAAAASEPVAWRPEASDTPALAADDPRAAALALGSIRLTRAVVASELPRGASLLRLEVDPATLSPLGDGAARPLALDVGLSPRAENVLTFIVWGLLVLAFVGLLRQPQRRDDGSTPPANASEAEAATAVPSPFLRIFAGMVDALPIVFALGLFAASGGELPRATNVILFAVGLLAYVLVPMMGELLSGRSIGKMLFGLRVISAVDAGPAPAWSIVLRNLIRPIDLCGGILAARFTQRAQRLGDLLGKTAVVRSPVQQDGQEPPATE